MNLREWALVAFTLLMQASAGILVVVAALHPAVSRDPLHGGARAMEVPVLVAAGAALLALAASLAHLGQPAQAWLAVVNARSSWLSREIVLAVLFTAAVAVTAWVFRSDTASPSARHAAAIAAAVLGVLTVYAMSRLYMVPAQPVWNRVVTPLNFFAAALVLGATVVAATARHASPAPSLIVVTIALLAAQVLLLLVSVASLPGDTAAAISAASADHVAAWLVAGKAVAAVGAGVLLASLLRTQPPAPALAASALVLVAASEILGRVLFYASSVRL